MANSYINMETVSKSPIDFIYIFATNDYISAIARGFSASHAATISEKRTNATRAINGWWKEKTGNKNAEYNQAKSEVSRLIQAQYGKTPEKILVELAQGKMVAGKDFKAGVFGVGDGTSSLTFAQNPNATVNPTTGAITFKGVDTSAEGLAKANATINAQGKAVEMNYTLGGKVYTSYYNPTTGKFVAGTYGDQNGMQFANGSTYDPSKAASVWQNINTAVPIVQNCITWMADLVADLYGKFNPITPQNTVPAQTDFYTKSGSGLTTAGFGVAGALVIGALLLGGTGVLKGKKK